MIRSPAGFDGGDRIKRYLDYYQPSYGIMMLSAGQFSPAMLFAAGEQGAWYDPSDLTTMFQDAAGTTPVTAVEQPVGRILDKSGRGNHASQSTSAARPVLSARVNLLVGTATLATQSVTTVATTYTLSFSGAGSITLSGTKTGTYSAGTNTLTGVTAGTLTLTVSGTVTNADLRVSNAGVNLPVYQSVVTATDYDTTGFPLYLKFDGADDFLQSSTITPGADKAQVFAGVRKLSDADAMIAELSTAIGTNAGSINLLANLGFNPNLPGVYSSGSRGSATVSPGQFASSANTYLSPVSNVLSMQANIAADTNVLRANSVNVASATGDQGTGNYLAYPIYVGARFGSSTRSLFFNGHLYSLILRFSATNLDAATITATETWVNGKTYAY